MTANVALFGRFCAGKTTLAEALTELGYTRVSMAANMKQMVLEVYGTLDKSQSVEVTKRDGSIETMSVRGALQGLGEIVKDVDRDIWLKWFIADSQFITKPQVMDDARLHFEAKALRDRGWLLVKVDTPEGVRLQRYYDLYGRQPSRSEMDHPTETESDFIEYDMVVDGMTSPALVAEAILIRAEREPWGA